MADVATRFRDLLLADSAIANKVGRKVHQATVPEGEEFGPPFVFFKRTSVVFERTLGTTGADPFRWFFDVDCVGLNLDEAQELADEIRGYDGYSGTFADTTCKGIFVDDQTDEYETQFGDHVASLSVEVIP